MPSLDPTALAQLPFAAFLLLLAVLGSRGVWVWGRELAKSEREVAEWKGLATKVTETAATQGAQITKLTDLVDTLSRAALRGAGP